MFDALPPFPWEAAICAALLLLSILINWDRARLRRRTRELELAGQGLDTHYAAVDRFADDPDAPEALVDFLDDFSETIGDQDAAQRLAREVLALSGNPDKTRAPIRDELEALRRLRPDLADIFETALGSGLAALFLQWPENVRLFSEAMMRLASDPSHGATYVAKARAKLKADDRGGSFGAGRIVPA